MAPGPARVEDGFVGDRKFREDAAVDGRSRPGEARVERDQREDQREIKYSRREQHLSHRPERLLRRIRLR